AIDVALDALRIRIRLRPELVRIDRVDACLPELAVEDAEAINFLLARLHWRGLRCALPGSVDRQRLRRRIVGGREGAHLDRRLLAEVHVCVAVADEHALA